MRHDHTKRRKAEDFLAGIPEHVRKMTLPELQRHIVDLDYVSGDWDAISLMVGCGKAIFKEREPYDKKALVVDIVGKDGLEALVVLNHAQTYLEDRAKYLESGHIQARGYITVT